MATMILDLDSDISLRVASKYFSEETFWTSA